MKCHIKKALWLSAYIVLMPSAHALGIHTNRTKAGHNSKEKNYSYDFQDISTDNDWTWTAYATDPGDLGAYTHATLQHNDYNGKSTRDDIAVQLPFDYALLSSSPTCALFQTSVFVNEPPTYHPYSLDTVFQTCKSGSGWSSWQRTNLPIIDNIASVAPDNQWIWVSSHPLVGGYSIRHYRPIGEDPTGVLEFAADWPTYYFTSKVTQLSSTGGKCVIGWLEEDKEVIQFCNDDGKWWDSWRKMPGPWTQNTSDINITALSADEDYAWLAIQNPNTKETKIYHLDFNGNLAGDPYSLPAQVIGVVKISSVGNCAVAAAVAAQSEVKFFRICKNSSSWGSWVEFTPDEAPTRIALSH